MVYMINIPPFTLIIEDRVVVFPIYEVVILLEKKIKQLRITKLKEEF